MTTQLEQAARQALEALVQWTWIDTPPIQVNAAITSLRQAIEQASSVSSIQSDVLSGAEKQEPVADSAFEKWWDEEGSAAPKHRLDCEEHCYQIAKIAWSNGAYKAQESYPPTAPVQEPVAKVVLTETLELPCLQWLDLNRQFDFKGGEYLYTAPQPQQIEKQEPIREMLIDTPPIQINEAITALRAALSDSENNGGKTGWPPGLLQDDHSGLSRWLASKPDARQKVRESLEQPAQQQGSHTFYDGEGNVVVRLDTTADITMDYTKPSAWAKPAQGCDYCNHPQYAGIKCKNCGRVTEQPAQDEPFGHVTVRRLSQRFENHVDLYHFYPAGQPPYLDNADECHAVYTRPQAREPQPCPYVVSTREGTHHCSLSQREWVDLTDDEMLMIYGQEHEGKKYNLGRMVQAKLKEKNT